MGYSCTHLAMKTLELINTNKEFTSQNSWRADNGKEYFYEIGKENQDGSITGSIIRMDGYRAGSFRIEPHGEITRFPFLPKRIRKMLSEEMSLRKAPFRLIPKGAKLNPITLMYEG